MLIRISLFAIITINTAIINAQNVGIIPVPREIEYSNQQVTVDGFSSIAISPNITELSEHSVTELQNDILEYVNISLNILKYGEEDKKQMNIYVGNPDTDPFIKKLMDEYGLTLDDKMRKEGYVLGTGNKGIVIGAVSDAGILYGTKSLKQMALHCNESWTDGYISLPHVKIHDWPAMEMRGIHDDIARGQVSTTENYKDIIRFLSEVKMNTLMIYLEDAFRFETYPNIGVGRGAFTKAKVDELEAFAKLYNVQIIPIFQLLDHHSQVLSIPEFKKLAEFPGSGSLRISEETYTFLENCVKELSEAFDSEYFHAGLDESWDLGTGASKSLVDSLGRAAVHAKHYNRVHGILKKYGKRMIMYNRVSLEHPEMMEIIPKDIIHMYYSYSAKNNFPGIEKAGNKGFTMGVHPGMNNWQRFFPDISEAMVNIRNLTLEAHKNNAWGSAVCTWGDYGGKNFREMLYYGYGYQGEVAWSPESRDIDDYGTRFFNFWNGKQTAPYFKTIYSILEQWPYEWRRGRTIMPYFRHPFLPNVGGYYPDPKEIQRIKNRTKLALDLIDEVDKVIEFRSTDLDYLEFCARTHLNMIEMEVLASGINSIDTNSLNDENMNEVVMFTNKRIRNVINELIGLKELFKELWLRTNLPANLAYNLNSYAQLMNAWQQTITRVEQGTFEYNPVTPAQWIYHPDAFNEKQHVGHACFRKTFNIANKPKFAFVQLIGDTHVKLFVNGIQINEQFVRKNLVPQDDKMIGLYDLTDHIKKGKNIIAIEAWNYMSGTKFREPGGPHGSAGFHLYGQMKYDDEIIIEIASDSTWKVYDIAPEDWNTLSFDDESWKLTEIDEFPAWLVTYPDFVNVFRGYVVIR